jgi:hypothetical protein
MGHAVARIDAPEQSKEHTPVVPQNTYTPPPPPLRNLLFKGYPPEGIYTGPFRKLGNGWSKTGITGGVNDILVVFFMVLYFI